MLWIWIGVFVIALIGEAITVSFASIMVGLGAIVALLLGLAGVPQILQIFAFIVSSIIFLLSLKPLAKKYFIKDVPKTNIDAIMGERGFVTGRISNMEQVGEVKVKGLHYTARNVNNDEVIEVGTPIEAVRIEGVKLFVTTALSSKETSVSINKE